ncbi:flagellar protein FlaG [Rehaibacterium terrae]|jgi:flagellar protein FlaG|uniref:Flagellar protein FlaG n=1 Tax=Rehaibacterium terrae TaxID=1341696 RepID=A0A7W8DFL2_9GAMM|nr:flagellar protein FlaG [Rehaibacterium terrae]MBB5016485.1 hypothetical protein [Rehaibacterium terrae]
MSADIGPTPPALPVSPAPSVPSGQAEARALQAHYDQMLARSELKFHVVGEPPRVVVQVIDGRTGEVVRQIPNEDALRLAEEFSRRGPSAGGIVV